MLMCTELGLVDDARRLIERLAHADFTEIPKDDMYVASLAFCAEACCKLDDVHNARKLYMLLSPYDGQTANYPRAACLGAAALYLAMLARTMGEPDTARRHFDAAQASHRAMNAWPWLARTEFHYGALLLTLDNGAEQARGRELLRDAEQLASRLGMQTLIDDIGTLLRGSDEQTEYPDGLTAREVEVLRLLAIGRSNKDISTVLTISLNTVATHVRNILNKTHCANRTEAAAYAIRHDLQASGNAPARKPSTTTGRRE
jgi:ATP/maltotriose-dependent transcriptional regulator MalT